MSRKAENICLPRKRVQAKTSANHQESYLNATMPGTQHTKKSIFKPDTYRDKYCQNGAWLQILTQEDRVNYTSR